MSMHSVFARSFPFTLEIINKEKSNKAKKSIAEFVNKKIKITRKNDTSTCYKAIQNVKSINLTLSSVSRTGHIVTGSTEYPSCSNPLTLNPITNTTLNKFN